MLEAFAYHSAERVGGGMAATVGGGHVTFKAEVFLQRLWNSNCSHEQGDFRMWKKAMGGKQLGCFWRFLENDPSLPN